MAVQPWPDSNATSANCSPTTPSKRSQLRDTRRAEAEPQAVKALAKELDVPLQSRATVASTIDDIVKVFVRSRLTADAIRRY
jgi:hypothetical protein